MSIFSDRRRLLLVGTVVGLAIGATILFILNSIGLSLPGPSAYCKALELRHIAKDCADDPQPTLPEQRSMTFAVLSSGQRGELVVFRSMEAYKAAMRAIPKRDDFGSNHADTKRERYVFGSKNARLLLYVPAPLDGIDVAGFMNFELHDADPLARGATISEQPAQEHPVHTDACVHAPACLAEGKCAAYPSDLNTCVAGFNEACIASTLCAKQRPLRCLRHWR